MSFSFVEYGRQRIQTYLENRKGGLRHRERHGRDPWVGELGVATTSELKMHTIQSAFQPARRRIMSRCMIQSSDIFKMTDVCRRCLLLTCRNFECPLRVRLRQSGMAALSPFLPQ